MPIITLQLTSISRQDGESEDQKKRGKQLWFSDYAADGGGVYIQASYIPARLGRIASRKTVTLRLKHKNAQRLDDSVS
jgi:hypothetical protein